MTKNKNEIQTEVSTGAAANNDQKKDDKKKKVATAVAVGAAVLVILALLRGCGGKAPTVDDEPTVSPGYSIGLDENSEEGDLTRRSPEEIIASLNEKVQEGMIRISMNTTITFDDGESEGALGIVNKDTNNYPQVVYIYLQDDEETGVYNEFAGRNVIYCSGAIPVGSKIERAKLDVDLDPGEYECVVSFNNYDLETGTKMGEARTTALIKVLG